MSASKRWLQYLHERSPLAVLLPLCGGVVGSAWALGTQTEALFPAIYSGIYLLLFFVWLRFMDELKDYQKDLQAHPKRPLPRGLIQVSEMKNAVLGTGLVFIVMTGFLYRWGGLLPTLLGGVTWAWAWLMYVEFFVGERLSKRPLAYAFTHQIVVIPLYWVVGLLLGVSPTAWMDYVLLNLCMGFAFELGRKLDPKSHPALKTYLQVIGPFRSYAALLALIGFAGSIAARAGWGWIVLPFAGLFGVSALWSWYQLSRGADNGPKKVEAIAALACTIALWAPLIQRWIR